MRVAPAHAHADPVHPLPIAHWTANLWLIGLLTLATLFYVRGQRARGRVALRGRSARRLESAAYALAILSLVVALLSPLDALSELTFAAHMTQHELLMLLAAPLLVMARPLPAYVWALPKWARTKVAALLTQRGARNVFRWLSAPLIALLLHGVVRWAWHVPLLFDAALDNEWIHGVQHASFFLTAVLFWWSLMQGRYGKAGYGVSVLFVLCTSIHTGALGALLSFADGPWYPGYISRARPYGIDPTTDQQLAGLIMWVGAGVVFLLAGLALCFAWLGEARQRARHSSVALLRAAPRSAL